MSVVSICRIVSTYLVHHGYCGTAEAFSRSTGQSIEEEMSSIKHRQSKFYHNFLFKYSWADILALFFLLMIHMFLTSPESLTSFKLTS